MKELPNFNDEDLLLNIYMKKLRTDISIYILTKNLKNTFYNLSDFFLVNKIDNNEIKKDIFRSITNELLESKLLVAHVFNKTGIVICIEHEDFDNNVWKSNLDYTIMSS